MRKKHLIALLIILVLSACVPAENPAAAPHWTYAGEEGPAHWGELDSAYAACATGQQQSPIDLSSPTEQDLANIVFHYEPSAVNIFNNGHTVQVNYAAGSYIELDGLRYDLLQIQYHTPSEHAVNGQLFAAEFHLVHKAADGTLAVVGILLKQGSESAVFEPFINNLPREKGEPIDMGVQINAADFLPIDQTTYRYSGSLTTPPCSEGVHWNVLTTPVEASAEQLNTLRKLFEHANNRPLQSLNSRQPLEDNTP